MALTTFRPVQEKNNHILGLFGDFSSSFELGIKVVDSTNEQSQNKFIKKGGEIFFGNIFSYQIPPPVLWNMESPEANLKEVILAKIEVELPRAI